MARCPRIEFPGAVYHVMSRGNRGEPIYRDTQDREVFLNTLDEACNRCGWQIHAFVLMGNHYHLLLETPEANLVAGMKWLQGTYTRRFNCRHKMAGHLLQGRYKALVVDVENGEYFARVSSYIHLNPARAGLIGNNRGSLDDFRWSSYPYYIRPKQRPPWLEVRRTLGNLQVEDNAKGLAWFRRYMHNQAAEVQQASESKKNTPPLEEIRSGWCLGDDAFRARMKQLASDRIRKYDRRSFAGEATDLHDQQEAEQLVQAGLCQLHVLDAELPAMRKGDARKQVLAWHVRRNTCVRNDWIAERLCMGRSSNLSRYVRQVEQTRQNPWARLKEMIK